MPMPRRSSAPGADQPFVSVDHLWRRACSPRAGVSAASLVQIAEADAFLPSLRLARREALWAIKGCGMSRCGYLRPWPFAKQTSNRNCLNRLST